jgi:hypothetical protein
MICTTHRCVFVHVPKTAGQSVEHFFMNLLGMDWDTDRPALLLNSTSDPARGTEKLAHLSAAEYVRCGHMTAADFDSFFKFSFVRNPWERLVSEYRYRNYFSHLSFRDFVMNRFPSPGFDDQYRHVMSQFDMLHSQDGELLVDFVGRFESLQQDFDRVCERLGIPESTLPHINSSNKQSRHIKRRVKNLLYFNGENGKRHYSEFYDDETRHRVSELYARDAETFGYKFGD